MKSICKSRAYFVFALTFIALLAPAFIYSNEAVSSDYQKEFDKFKTELIASRKNNWIPLVGLFWLKDGPNSFGSDAANAIILPAGKIAAHAGTFTLQNGNVTIDVASGVQAKIDGKIAVNASLQSDDTDKVTKVEIGSLMMHVIKRGQRIGIRVKDLNNMKAETYPGPVFYPLNMEYRVTAKWIPATG